MTADLPDIEMELVKFTKEGKSYPVGSGRLTKKKTGYALEIFPGQSLRGKIYLFPKGSIQKVEQPEEQANQSAPAAPVKSAFKARA